LNEKLEAILEVCKDWAYDAGGHWLISISELAWHLNNNWKSPLFFKEWEFKRYGISREASAISVTYYLPDYELWHLGNRLVTTLKKVDAIEIIKQRAGIWLQIPKEVEQK